MTHVAKIDVRGSGLVGLYMIAMDNLLIVGHEVPEILDETLKEVFKIPIFRTTIAGTSLIGVFCATDGTTLLVPSIIFEFEEEKLKKAGIKYEKIKTTFTCLGNNILATKKGTIINPEFEAEAEKEISKAFCTPILKMEIAENPTVGSFLVHNDNFGLITPDVSDKDAEIIEKHLGIQLTSGTVEMGSTQVRSAIVANNEGFVIGEYSGGPEVVNADRAFDFSE
ncbi:MAG: translation initiation factor IF-6 [Candidatus Woesearchaeota archaeon]